MPYGPVVAFRELVLSETVNGTPERAEKMGAILQPPATWPTQPLPPLKKGSVPHHGENETLAHIKVAVAVIQRWDGRVEIAQIADPVGSAAVLGEGGAQIVEGM